MERGGFECVEGPGLRVTPKNIPFGDSLEGRAETVRQGGGLQFLEAIKREGKESREA